MKNFGLDEPLPVVQPTATIDMHYLYGRLKAACNTAADEYSPIGANALELVGKYMSATDETARLLLLGHLYFTTTAALRVTRVRKFPFLGGVIFNGMTPFTRREMLRELYVAVAGLLTHCFDTTINVLPRYLEDRFGIEMSEHGFNVDSSRLKSQSIIYLDQAARARYRVVIRQGRAFVLNGKGLVAKEVPLDTYGKQKEQDRHRDNAWGFVLSLSRELYTINHLTESTMWQDFFHSSYFKGQNILTAGDCIFKNGYLESVTNLSGHYQPPDASLRHFLELFKTHGANLDNVLVGCVVKIWSRAGQGITKSWNKTETFESDAYTAAAYLASPEFQEQERTLFDASKTRGRHRMQDFRRILEEQGKL